MNIYLQEFINLNKGIISDLFMIVTGEAEKICYLFLSGKPKEEHLELLTKASFEADEFLDIVMVPAFYNEDVNALKEVTKDACIL